MKTDIGLTSSTSSQLNPRRAGDWPVTSWQSPSVSSAMALDLPTSVAFLTSRRAWAWPSWIWTGRWLDVDGDGSVAEAIGDVLKGGGDQGFWLAFFIFIRSTFGNRPYLRCGSLSMSSFRGISGTLVRRGLVNWLGVNSLKGELLRMGVDPPELVDDFDFGSTDVTDFGRDFSLARTASGSIKFRSMPYSFCK